MEEEGEKNRAAAVSVKIDNEVALYILNQKRHELSRIEAENGMEITFDPRPGMAGGAFEIERTKVREPGERPRSNSAVSIEAGFVAYDEPEPDYVEEVEEEEVFEAEDGPQDAESEDTEERAPRSEGERSGGDRGGERKRRRRGGRGRNRDREGPRPVGADTAAPAVAAEIPEGADDDGDEAENASAQPGQQPLGENGEPRRKRRRRRGRRGGRERGERPEPEGIEHHQTGFAVEADRFGAAPDEIDTTPTLGGSPGAPSAPVWSLKDDELDTTPKDDKPVKKGWWQKAFGGE